MRSRWSGANCRETCFGKWFPRPRNARKHVLETGFQQVSGQLPELQGNLFWKLVSNKFLALEPSSKSHQIVPPGTGFVNFWNQNLKVSKSSLLGLVLSTFGTNARKLSNRTSWNWFCRIREPKPENHKIEPPRTGFVDLWSHGPKFIKSNLLGLL